MSDPAEGKTPRRKRTKAEVEPRGLTARAVGTGAPPAPAMRIMKAIGADGASVFGR